MLMEEFSGQEVPVDFSEALSLRLIRQHIKADDDPLVTDELLTIYRGAALEACEAYTGRIFSKMKTVIEDIGTDSDLRRRKNKTFVTLRYPSVDGEVKVFGGAMGKTITVRAKPGAKRISIPLFSENINCCNPCDDNEGVKALYRTGVSCEKDIPYNIIVGVYKYIAWLVAHPGDELVTVRDKAAIERTGVGGTNWVAWASGAIQDWNIYRPLVPL